MAAIFNVVIEKPIVAPQGLLAYNADDWRNNEKTATYFTEIRFLLNGDLDELA